MSVARITQNQADEVERLRKAGRTDRQIETMLGLTYGLLGKPYRVAEDPRPTLDTQWGRRWVYPPRTEGQA